MTSDRRPKPTEIPPAALEGRQPPDGTPSWHEAHRLHATDGVVSVFAQLAVHAGAGEQARAAVHVVVGGLGPHPVVLADNELPVPARRWEIRSSGLWVEFVCEEPLVHWSYGLEAFALALDDRRALLDRGYGHRVPLGWELQFVASHPADVLARPSGSADGGVDGGVDGRADVHYHQPGVVDGVLLDAGGEREFTSTVASRWHWSGSRSVPTGSDEHQPDAVALPTPTGVIWVAP